LEEEKKRERMTEVNVKNPHLSREHPDYLYHLGIAGTDVATVNMFSDTKVWTINQQRGRNASFPCSKCVGVYL
jgi:hypothetical protein